jgi:hypothetical protein
MVVNTMDLKSIGFGLASSSLATPINRLKPTK